MIRSASPLEGLLLVNKPSGPTSHDVVALLRRKLGLRRIGHAGTLDPMAQGLLILLIGRATERQQSLQSHEKAYRAVLRLGTQTDTGDAMGMPLRRAAVPVLEPQRVIEVLAAFRGPLSQTPPAYSAIKVRGRPAYWWARQGRAVALPKRVVHLSSLELLSCERERIAFHVCCSAGTYIRALAESIAERLGTVGHLTELIRLRVGPWELEEAKPLSWVEQAASDALARELKPVPNPHPSALSLSP